MQKNAFPAPAVLRDFFSLCRGKKHQKAGCFFGKNGKKKVLILLDTPLLMMV